MLRLERIVTVHGETKITVQYAVTSLSRDQADAATLLHWWRGRWAIENRLFWVRDVVFGEDHSRIRTGTAPQTMSLMFNVAINFLRTLDVKNLKATLREHALNVDLLLARLGILEQS